LGIFPSRRRIASGFGPGKGRRLALGFETLKIFQGGRSGVPEKKPGQGEIWVVGFFRLGENWPRLFSPGLDYAYFTGGSNPGQGNSGCGGPLEKKVFPGRKKRHNFFILRKKAGFFPGPGKRLIYWPGSILGLSIPGFGDRWKFLVIGGVRGQILGENFGPPGVVKKPLVWSFLWARGQKKLPLWI